MLRPAHLRMAGLPEFKSPLQELSIPSLEGMWGINVLTNLWKEEQRMSLFPIDVGAAQ